MAVMRDEILIYRLNQMGFAKGWFSVYALHCTQEEVSCKPGILGFFSFYHFKNFCHHVSFLLNA